MSEKEIHSTTQAFLDVFDITNDMVILKDGTVSMILQIGTMNFSLLAEQEQDAVIFTYGSLLNSLNFPIQINIQSQTKDATNYLNLLDEQLKKVTSQRKANLIRRYQAFVSELIRERNVLEKKFFVIIPSSPTEMGLLTAQNVLPGKTDFDIRTVEKTVILEKAANILEPRREHLISQFNRLGLFTRQLNTQEIIQNFYINYNPEATEGQEITNSNSYSTPLVRASFSKNLMQSIQENKNPDYQVAEERSPMADPQKNQETVEAPLNPPDSPADATIGLPIQSAAEQTVTAESPLEAETPLKINQSPGELIANDNPNDLNQETIDQQTTNTIPTASDQQTITINPETITPDSPDIQSQLGIESPDTELAPDTNLSPQGNLEQTLPGDLTNQASSEAQGIKLNANFQAPQSPPSTEKQNLMPKPLNEFIQDVEAKPFSSRAAAAEAKAVEAASPKMPDFTEEITPLEIPSAADKNTVAPPVSTDSLSPNQENQGLAAKPSGDSTPEQAPNPLDARPALPQLPTEPENSEDINNLDTQVEEISMTAPVEL